MSKREYAIQSYRVWTLEDVNTDRSRWGKQPYRDVIDWIVDFPLRNQDMGERIVYRDSPDDEWVEVSEWTRKRLNTLVWLREKTKGLL